MDFRRDGHIAEALYTDEARNMVPHLAAIESVRKIGPRHEEVVVRDDAVLSNVDEPRRVDQRESKQSYTTSH